MPHFDDKAWAAVLKHEDTKLDKPVTPDAMDAFEANHKLKLPDANREFLLKGNGGVVGIVRLFGIGRDDHLDLARQLAEMRADIEGMADGPVLPFASDWGGSYFCYDLRKAATPKGYPVLYWNHEYSEEPDDRPMLWKKYAPDFVGFIKKVIKD